MHFMLKADEELHERLQRRKCTDEFPDDGVETKKVLKGNWPMFHQKQTDDTEMREQVFQ
jgi:hypothetical protein